MRQVVSFLQARLRAIIVVIVLIVAAVSLVSHNRSVEAALEATLAGGTQSARDAAVRGLVENGRLVDVLISTQNPEQDKTSPRNQRSLLIRTNATDSVNRLTAEGKLTPQQSFDTLFSLCKDADVKTAAETGLQALGSQSDANLQSVVDRLSNGDPDIRGAAVDVLGLIGGDKAAVTVNAVLPIPGAQDSAIAALQKIGAPSVPLIVAHLEDPKMQNDIAFRQQMAGVLDQIAAPASVPELIKIAGQPAQPSVQRLAQVALADTVLAAQNTVQTARDGVATAKDAPGRTAAQVVLTKAQAALLTVQSAEPILIGVLRDPHAASEARVQSALALGRFATPSTITTLVSFLGDLDGQVRDAAQIGLQSSGAPAVGPLTAALTRSPVLSRTGAAQALGGIGTPSAVAALNAVFADPSTPASVRESAVIGLGRSGSPRVIPRLVQALGDPDGIVAGAAQDGLLTPTLARPAIPALVAALGDPGTIPFNASQTLARMGTLAQSQVVPRLTAAIRAGSAPTQTWAAITLGEIGTKDAPVLTALQGLSTSPDPHVRYAASESLEKLSGA